MIFCILFLLSYTGGPDGFGYYYIDSREPEGPSFNWIDYTGGTHLVLGYDANSGLIDIIPGDFWFYGTGYSSIAICSNGWASFTSTSTQYPSVSLPHSMPQPPGFINILAPLAGDLGLETRDIVNVYWDTIGTRLVIGWDSVPPLVGSGVSYTFEIVLDCSDSSVTFQYLTHEGAGNPWTLWFFLTGIGAEDTTDGLVYPYWGRKDSLAIRFFYNANPDILPLSIDYPGDAFLVEPNQPCSIRTRIMNAGPGEATSFTVQCIVDSLGTVVYSEQQLVENLMADDTRSITFDGWIPQEFIDYRLRVITEQIGDPEPSNDTIGIKVKAPGPASDSLYYYSGNVENGFYAGRDTILALFFHTDSTPALLKYVRLWLISEGDALHPYPDMTLDPIVLSVMEGMEEPTDVVYTDTIWRDTLPPGWVYSVPSGSLFVGTNNFWVGIQNDERAEGVEGIGMDATTDNGEVKWMYEREVWSIVDWGTGDPLLSVFFGGDVTEIIVEEETYLFFLGRLSPNPMRESFTINYGIDRESEVEISVYDVSGRKLRKIFSGSREPGVYSTRWDLTDNTGIRVASGVYFLRLSSDSKVESKRFVIF